MPGIKGLLLVAMAAAMMGQDALANVSKAAIATPTGNPGYWITPEDYPAPDLRKEAEGVTGVRLDVNTDGIVSNCTVTQSSGSETLDAATCTLIQERARFTPARDRTGQPIADNYTTRVKWQIPEADPEQIKEYPKRLQLRFDINEAGETTACTVLANEGNATVVKETGETVDPCATMMKSKKRPVFLDVNGEPVAVRVESLMEMRVTSIGAAKAP